MTDVRSERFRKRRERSTDPRGQSDGHTSKPSERDKLGRETASENGHENPGSDPGKGENTRRVSSLVVQCGVENLDSLYGSERRTRTRETA
jgi:hypothetical protein